MLACNSLAMYRQTPSGQQTISQQTHQQHSQQSNGEEIPQQYWYGYPHGHPHTVHPQSSGGPQQYLNPSDVLAWPPAHMHPYSHLQYQHQAFHQQHQHHHQQQQQQLSNVNDWSGDEGNSSLIRAASEPSPPITVSGSEISSPGTPATPPANNNNILLNNNNETGTPRRPSQIRSPYEWMKKPSYQTQPNSACELSASAATSVSTLHDICSIDALGKTRTKDKYRVVYTDHQRLELEKEFHYSRYITIRRKAELAANLALSERQVKIWFQNRRAKERKQTKKREDRGQRDNKPTADQLVGSMASLGFGGMSSMLGSLMQTAGPSSLTPHPLSSGQAPPALHLHQSNHSQTASGL